MNDYNSTQTGGVKSLQELKNKYKNTKSQAKAVLSTNVKEIRKTGGGVAAVDTSNVFNFSDTQIKGLYNPFDDDNVELEEIHLIEDETDKQQMKQDQVVTETPKSGMKKVRSSLVCFEHCFKFSLVVFFKDFNESSFKSLPKYSNKKMKFAASQHELVRLKEEGMRLDNDYKKLKIKKIKLEIAEMEKTGNILQSKSSLTDDSDG